MLTELGKFLRKLRIDHGEILKDMANKLNVTASFLSAVENGKKRMPSDWNTVIVQLYDFDQTQKDEFTEAIAKTERSIEMNFAEGSPEKNQLAISFARQFSRFDEAQVEAIKKILSEGE